MSTLFGISSMLFILFLSGRCCSNSQPSSAASTQNTQLTHPCYAPDGGYVAGDIPCGTVLDTFCCGANSYCLTNQICIDIDGGRYGRGSCTAENWAGNPGCPNFCIQSDLEWGAFVLYCGNGNYCCPNETSNDCCSTSSFWLAKGVPTLLGIVEATGFSADAASLPSAYTAVAQPTSSSTPSSSTLPSPTDSYYSSVSESQTIIISSSSPLFTTSTEVTVPLDSLPVSSVNTPTKTTSSDDPTGTTYMAVTSSSSLTSAEPSISSSSLALASADTLTRPSEIGTIVGTVVGILALIATVAFGINQWVRREQPVRP